MIVIVSPAGRKIHDSCIYCVVLEVLMEGRDEISKLSYFKKIRDGKREGEDVFEG